MNRWLCLSVALLLGPATAQPAAELEKFEQARLLAHPANDGDSFVVQAGQRQLHLRLYFVDCPESFVSTDADAKRVREQARYFGVTDVTKIVDYGQKAKEFTQRALAGPFTVYTAFASAMGRSPGGRVYAFVITADGKDLAGLLVENGYARLHGVRRGGPDGSSAAEIERRLQDLESKAMLKRAGLWAATDPDVLVNLRAEQQQEERQFKQLRARSSGKHAEPGSVELNTATTSELQSISGIGPVLAARIIAGRPYRSVEDLLRVVGIGPKLLEKIRPYVVVATAPQPPEQTP